MAIYRRSSVSLKFYFIAEYDILISYASTVVAWSDFYDAMMRELLQRDGGQIVSLTFIQSHMG